QPTLSRATPCRRGEWGRRARRGDAQWPSSQSPSFTSGSCGVRGCWILLLPGYDDEPVGIEREGGAVETAEELDLAPALRPQHVEQLVRRVEPDLALADQFRRAFRRLRRRALEPPPPGAPAAGRRIELVLDADRRAAAPHPLFGRQRPHALVAVAGVDDEGAAGLERAPEAVEHEAVLVLGEVADRAEEVHRQIELARELHVANVQALEGEGDIRLAGRLARAAELGLAEVHAGRVAAAPRELDRVPAEAARRVEHARAGLEPDDAGDPLHVARRVRPGLDRLRDLGPRFA